MSPHVRLELFVHFKRFKANFTLNLDCTDFYLYIRIRFYGNWRSCLTDILFRGDIFRFWEIAILLFRSKFSLVFSERSDHKYDIENDVNEHGSLAD